MQVAKQELATKARPLMTSLWTILIFFLYLINSSLISVADSLPDLDYLCNNSISSLPRILVNERINLINQSPPTLPPNHLIHAYTRCNTIPIEYFYVDDCREGKGTHYKYSEEDIEKLITEMNFLRINSQRRPAKYRWIFEALDKYYSKANNIKALVIGSMEPLFESILISYSLHHNSRLSLIVSEFNQLTYSYPDIQTLQPHQLQQNDEYKGYFDIIIAHAALDHSGLGRYCDLLGPDADLLDMDILKSLIKPNTGLLFLTVAIGPDLVVWNLQRRYGEIRLPLLLDGWIEVEKIGWNSARLTQQANYRQRYEPIFVLRTEQHQEL
jgi:hypothetical protein